MALTIYPSGKIVKRVFCEYVSGKSSRRNSLSRRTILSLPSDEIRAVGGNVGAFGDPKWAHHVLNVRYRLDNLDPYPPDSFLPDTKWFKDRHRYLLYAFDAAERERVERTFHGRRGSQGMPEARRLFRRGTKPVQCDPQHAKMQAKLMEELQQEYEPQCVRRTIFPRGIHSMARICRVGISNESCSRIVISAGVKWRAVRLTKRCLSDASLPRHNSAS